MLTARPAALVASLVLIALGNRALPAQNLLTHSFAFQARAFVFGELRTTNFTWSATRPVAEVFCQSPNSITTCRQAVTNSTLTIGGIGNFQVLDPFRIFSLSYAQQAVGGVGIEWSGGSRLFEVWNDQLLGHNLGGPLAPLPSAGPCGGNGGVTNLDCVFGSPSLAFWTIATTGGDIQLTTILEASYSAAWVPPGRDPDTGEGLPPIDPDPDGEIPPFLDCRITIANCPPVSEVPEPGTLWLLSAGLAGIALVHRTCRRRYPVIQSK
jgi:hypothetical protein